MTDKGILFGIGVGPGDPELLTLRAVRAIKECAVIAMPDHKDRLALEIAREYVAEKPLLPLELPMTRDKDELAKKRNAAADKICERLENGENVGFLTLGDPTVYATYTYLHRLVAQRGYEARIIPGVTSFCAAAAALGRPLCEGAEPLHIIPALYGEAETALKLPGTKVLMKSGAKLNETLALIRENGLEACLAERVGLNGERLVGDISTESFDDAGYFCVVIVREKKSE